MATALPPFRTLVESALRKNKTPDAKYIQVSTLSHDGWPACRTVVFRGFLNATANSFAIHSDSRANKVRDFAATGRAEVCWYLTKTRQQLRIRAQVRVLSLEVKEEISFRKAQWKTLSPKARDLYAQEQGGTSVAGQQTGPEEEGDEPVDLMLHPGLVNFGVYIFEPVEVELLDLRAVSQWPVKIDCLL